MGTTADSSGSPSSTDQDKNEKRLIRGLVGETRTDEESLPDGGGQQGMPAMGSLVVDEIIGQPPVIKKGPHSAWRVPVDSSPHDFRKIMNSQIAEQAAEKSRASSLFTLWENNKQTKIRDARQTSRPVKRVPQTEITLYSAWQAAKHIPKQDVKKAGRQTPGRQTPEQETGRQTPEQETGRQTPEQETGRQTRQENYLWRLTEMRIKREEDSTSEEAIGEIAESAVQVALREIVDWIAKEKDASAPAVQKDVIAKAVREGKRMQFLIGLAKTWEKWMIIKKAADLVIKKNTWRTELSAESVTEQSVAEQSVTEQSVAGLDVRQIILMAGEIVAEKMYMQTKIEIAEDHYIMQGVLNTALSRELINMLNDSYQHYGISVLPDNADLNIIFIGIPGSRLAHLPRSARLVFETPVFRDALCYVCRDFRNLVWEGGDNSPWEQQDGPQEERNHSQEERNRSHKEQQDGPQEEQDRSQEEQNRSRRRKRRNRSHMEHQDGPRLQKPQDGPRPQIGPRLQKPQDGSNPIVEVFCVNCVQRLSYFHKFRCYCGRTRFLDRCAKPSAICKDCDDAGYPRK